MREGVQISCTIDNKGVVHEKIAHPRYLTTKLPDEHEETWPRCNEPFIVDIDGFIIYLDDHPHLREEARVTLSRNHPQTSRQHNLERPTAKIVSSRILHIKKRANDRVIQLLLLLRWLLSYGLHILNLYTIYIISFAFLQIQLFLSPTMSNLSCSTKYCLLILSNLACLQKEHRELLSWKQSS